MSDIVERLARLHRHAAPLDQSIFSEAVAEIEALHRQLEYAYRCINVGFEFGTFDFSHLRKAAVAYVKEIET